MPLTNQEKGRKCEEFWEPKLRGVCPVKLEHLRKGADLKCGNALFEIKSCKSTLTRKQKETKARIEETGGKDWCADSFRGLWNTDRCASDSVIPSEKK